MSMYEYPIIDLENKENNKDLINRFSREKNKLLNIHLGCGKNIYPDYINIDFLDISEGKKINPDIILDIRKIDEYVLEQTVNKILIIHVLEHFNRWECVEILKKFFKILNIGGIIEIEMPDLDGCIEFYTKNIGKPYKSSAGPINKGLVQFYGNQWDGNIHETHKYLWRKEEVCEVLKNIGFHVSEISNNARFHVKKRDMYIVATRTQ